MHRATRIARRSCLQREAKIIISTKCCSFSTFAQRRPCSFGVGRPSAAVPIGTRANPRPVHPGLRSFSETTESKRNTRIIRSARILSVVLALSVLGGLQFHMYFRYLERVPQTGRWRKMNIKPEVEDELGEEAYFSLLSQYRDAVLPENHPITRLVRKIASTIVEANGLGIVVPPTDSSQPFANSSNELRQWRLAVIADNSIPNSTASSGGIIVFTGLLSLCENEDELAAVLGHEIAHVVARHLAERYSKAKDWSFKQLLFWPSHLKTRQQAEEEYRQIMSTNLHDQELEADAIGLQLCARACFDPRAAITVNQRLARIEDRLRRIRPDHKPAHPCSEERIKQLERLLPQNENMLKNPGCS